MCNLNKDCSKNKIIIDNNLCVVYNSIMSLCVLQKLMSDPILRSLLCLKSAALCPIRVIVTKGFPFVIYARIA